MPLLSVFADVNIAGVIANVEIRQTYTNNENKPIEAIYIFPASTKAEVHAMSMIIGKRIVKAKIEESKKAEYVYKKAKSQFSFNRYVR